MRRISALLLVTALGLGAVACANGDTSANSYNATPIHDGASYQPVNDSENDRSPTSPRNNIQCFQISRTWQSGGLRQDDNSLILGTYCRVPTTKDGK